MLARAGILVALLSAPALALAAFDDVSLATNVALDIGGIEVNVSGDTAAIASITVNASDFSFDLVSGSSIQVTAPNRNVLSASSPRDVDINTCTSASSILKYTGTGTHTITITPSASLCSSASSSGGGGGGSTRAATPATPAVPATPIEGCAPGNLFNTLTGKSCTVSATPATPATPALQNASANARFNRDLQAGTSGNDVKDLQIFLNTHGYVIASSGPGSLGNETDVFGNLTKIAVIAYQKAKGIAPAIGYVGPKTRAQINAESGAGTSTVATPVATGTFERNLDIGTSGSDVRALQIFLNTHGYVIATTGPGSPGNETSNFGALTRAALAKYQKAKGITPSVGYFGPLTRVAINAEQ